MMAQAKLPSGTGLVQNRIAVRATANRELNQTMIVAGIKLPVFR